MQWVLVMIVLDLMMVTMMLMTMTIMLVTNMKIVNSFYEGIGVCCWLVIIARKQKIMNILDSKAILVSGSTNCTNLAKSWILLVLSFNPPLPCLAILVKRGKENTPKILQQCNPLPSLYLHFNTLPLNF